MRVLIWGTGKNAKRIVQIGIAATIVGIVETQRKSETIWGLPVFDADSIPIEYDYIIIANTHTMEIYRYIQEKGWDLKKYIFLNFCPYIIPEDNIERIKEVLGVAAFGLYCATYQLIEYSFFEDDKKKYKELNVRGGTFDINENDLWPVIDDKYANAGTVNNYFWQDLWAARHIYDNKPKEHFDIGSRIDGFIAHVLSFGVPVKMIDIRPFPAEIEDLETIVDDATLLTEFTDNSIESLSALCSLEHFGLGRYGDPIDPEACFICFENIQRKLRQNGKLYISVPVGRERLEFNAHRVFYPTTIVNSFPKMKLVDFAYTADGKLERTTDIHKYDDDCHDGNYRYGLFYFVKQ